MELTWTAEGGSDETTVTEANSGGASGTAWETVDIDATGALVYDTAQAAHGTYSMRHTMGVTSGQARAIWEAATIGSVARLYGRLYIRSSDMTSSRSICRIRGNNTQIVRLQIDATGHLELRNSGNTVVDTSTTVLADDTWYRLEFDVRPGNPVTNTVNIYVGDSTSLTEAVSASSNYSTQVVVDEFGVGNFANASNTPNTWFDSIQVNDTGLPGPAGGTNATATPAVIAVTAALPAAATSAGSTATPGVLAALAALPAASLSAGVLLTPATLAATVALPAAGPSAGSTATPGVLAALAGLPAATAATSGSATVTPAAVAATVALPAAGPSAGSTVSPAVLAAVAGLPAATASAGVLLTPATLAATVTLPAAALSAGSTATPDPVAAAAALPGAGPSAAAQVTPAVLAALAALPAATLSAGVLLTPATLAATVTLPAADAFGQAASSPLPRLVTVSTTRRAGYARSTAEPARLITRTRGARQ